MIAYLLLRRRDATYNYPLATSEERKMKQSEKQLKLTAVFANPQKSKESLRHIAFSANPQSFPTQPPN